MPILKTFSIFAKFWEKGRVKTRLGETIGQAEAAKLYHQFLRVCVELGTEWSGQRVIGFAPEERENEFQSLAPGWELVPQVSSIAGKPADLGTKMKCFFDHVFGNAPSDHDDHLVVLIGSDAPLLSIQKINQAFLALEKNDVVLGPSSDGGYYLIGAKNRTPEIFDGIRWSTDEVFDETIERLRKQQYRFHLLDVHDDVDDITDFRRMTKELASLATRNAQQDTLLELAQTALSKAAGKNATAQDCNDSSPERDKQ